MSTKRDQNIQSIRNLSSRNRDFVAVAEALEAMANDQVGFYAAKNAKLLFHQYSDGGITDAINVVTKNGAMTTAVIDKVGAYDRIAVGAGDGTSYFYITNRIYTAQNLVRRMRVRVDALGAAPLLGFCNLGVGGPWSNFTNGLGSIYVNLLTGAMTSAISGAITTTTYTNWTAAVVGDIVEVIMEFTNLDHYSLRIVKENKVGETSEVRHTYVPNSTGMHNICYAPAIMAGGTFRLLAEETYTPESPMNKVVLHGDSYLSGAAIAYGDSALAQLRALLPYPCASLSCGTMYVDGMLASLPDLLKLNPEFVLFSNVLEAEFGGAILAQGGAAFIAWEPKIMKYVNTLVQAGITPVMFTAKNRYWDQASADAKIAWWKLRYPNLPYVTIDPSELTYPGPAYDSTGFHLVRRPNSIIAAEMIKVMKNLGRI
jgi:hypothetical protein